MNKQRRKEIEEITAQMQDLRERLESVMDEEQDSYDNLPESFQNGVRPLCVLKSDTPVETI